MVIASTCESVALGPDKQNDDQETTVQNAASALKPTWKEITVEFITRTKIHGLKFVFSSDKSRPQRVIWILAFFVCVSLLMTWSLNRIFYLISYPAVTKIYMVWAHNMSFPAITFCNKNVFRASILTKDDLYHSGYWMDLMYPNHTVIERSLSILKDSHKQGLLSLLDFGNYTPSSDYHVNTTEMMGRLGHQLEDMLLVCRFRGETCTYRNFSTVGTERAMVFVRCGYGCCLQGALIIHVSIWWCSLQQPSSQGVLRGWCLKATNKPVPFLPLRRDVLFLIKPDVFKKVTQGNVHITSALLWSIGVMPPSMTCFFAQLSSSWQVHVLAVALKKHLGRRIRLTSHHNQPEFTWCFVQDRLHSL